LHQPPRSIPCPYTTLFRSGGNLGSALAQGLARTDEASSAYQVTVTRRNTGLIRHLEDEGITVTSDNIAAAEQADQIIIAVQPTQDRKSTRLNSSHVSISYA